MKRMLTGLLSLTLALSALPPLALAAELEGPSLVNLKTDGRVDPLGVDGQSPAFSWQLQSGEVGASQASYQVVVKDEEGTPIWDSGVVESSVSNEILYEGEALLPAKEYSWSVTVVDQAGRKIESEEAHFETSLLDEGMDSWEGAKWIGAGELSLDAASKAVFHVSADVTIPEGSESASFILGAEDFRLKNQVYNSGLLEGENYVRLELDLSQVTLQGGAKLNAYRCGYAPGEDGSTPFMTVEESEELNGCITSANAHEPHHVDIFCTASTLTFNVDGVDLPDKILVNAFGTSNTFPNLNSVGFAARPGQSAVFDGYVIENGGRFARGTLFGENIGAGYGIFEGLEGLTVEGGSIKVEGGEEGILVYADPSYGAAPMLRRGFEVKGEVKKARLYVSVQGVANLYLNGNEVAPQEWFNPGSTEYDQILGYNVYDVGQYLVPGSNALGAILGEGWWTGMTTFECLNNNYYGDQSALLAKLVVTYQDGSQDSLITEPQGWKYYGEGPVVLASFFQGERYDATREVEGWTLGDFDDSSWKDASLVETRKQFAHPSMVVRGDTPVHVIGERIPVSEPWETREGSGSYIYDLGVNAAGVPRITIPAELAKPGQTLTLRYAEILYPELEEYKNAGVDGLLMVENYRSALVTDFYTMKEGENVFVPDLTFHGYRYMEISGLSEPLPTDCVEQLLLSSLDVTATYESSNELTNQLFKNILTSTTSNYLSIPTDCPQRDERMGWTGDAQVFALSGSYAADTYNFMNQWMDTVRSDCGETGLSSQYCPAMVNYSLEEDDTIPHKGQSFGITWNCLVVTIPYNLYLQTGRKDILRRNIDNIYTYVDHLIETPLTYKDENKEKKQESRLTGETGTLCDHLSRIPTDGVMLGNAVFIACLDEAAMMAEALGDEEKAQSYRDRAVLAREAWNEFFIDPETGKTRNAKREIVDTQASYATPFRFHVISQENAPRALEHYLRTIQSPDVVDSDGLSVPPYSITTGFNATGNVLNALTDYGYGDVAYQMFESTDYASWLYPVTQGATSIWERWNGYTNELGFNGNNGMNSFNHYSFGAVYEWMVAYQLGIQADPMAPGYQHFFLQPTVGGSFKNVQGSFESVYGTIRSGWEAQEGKMTSLTVTVPANTSATLYLPMDGSLTECEGVTLVGETLHNQQQVQELSLVAGTYHFQREGEEIRVSLG